MKREFYSTSLVEAKGRGEIYKNDEKILEFENDLTFVAKKDIINLICGTPLNTGGGKFGAKTKLQSLNQIGLVCLRIDKDHLLFGDKPNEPQTLLAYTNAVSAPADHMNAYTGDGQTGGDSINTDPSAMFAHGGAGKLRKFGRCINGDEDITYRDMGEGFGIGRPVASSTSASANKTDKTTKFSSSITVGFNDVTFGLTNLVLADGAPGEFGQEYLVWSDLYGSGGTDASQLTDFIAVGSGTNDGYGQTSGLIQTDLQAGKTLIQYRADWNITGTQTAQQLGHLLDGERCILVGAYLMERTNVETGTIGNVDGGNSSTVDNQNGSTRAFNLDVTEDTSALSKIGAGEQLELYNDVYWTQNSMFAGKYLTEQSASTDVVQITPDDTVKGTYTIDFTPSSGKFGNPDLDNAVWSSFGANCARLGTHTVPTIVAGSTNGGTPIVGVQGCCDWSVALAEKFFAISATVGWDDGLPKTVDATKPGKLVDEFTTQEWFEAKDNQDGAGSGDATGSMAGKITHVGVANSGGTLEEVVDVTVATNGSNVTWAYDVDSDASGTYSNTCAVDFGNLSAGAIKNRLFFYSAGEGNGQAGGNHNPEKGDPTNYLADGGLKGGMFPIQVTKLKATGFNDPDDENSTIPNWNPGDKLIINFKIQWG